MLTKLAAIALGGYAVTQTRTAQCWIYRDDIGAFFGIKGYEEMVTEVGTHHGKMRWPQYSFLGQYDAGSVRRGWQVFARNCANCHGMIYRKYDFLLDRGYKQLELAAQVTMFSITPGHQHFKQYYYQEWDERDRVITDRIYPPYLSQDHAKNANGGVWPTDFSKISLRPGGVAYVYNVLTGYHFKPPFGMDVPKGKYFNPYFDHMIIGMPRQLYDGMIDYDDGTPASTPQMSYDVSNYISYMQRRVGAKRPDTSMRYGILLVGALCMYPLFKIINNGLVRNYLSYRFEVYAVRDGVYYKHFRTGGRSVKASYWRTKLWA